MENKTGLDSAYVIVCKQRDQLQAECERKDKVIAEHAECLRITDERVAIMRVIIDKRNAQLAKYKAALELIAANENTGIWHDGSSESIARAALAEGEPTPDKKDEIK
jgi:predicted RNA methylase